MPYKDNEILSYFFHLRNGIRLLIKYKPFILSTLLDLGDDLLLDLLGPVGDHLLVN
jgi:hypothetical protein